MLYADYSAAQLTGPSLKAAGFGGVIRYAGTRGNRKNTTADEVASLKAAGLEVHGVYEHTTTDFVGGYAAGVANAQALLADAGACGISGVLFMSADQHLTTPQIASWKAYLQGAQTVLGSRLGAYGFAEAIQAAKQVGVSYFWQCGSRSALVAGVHVYQRNTGATQVSGISVDVNDVLIDLGADDVAWTDQIPFPTTSNPSGTAAAQDVLKFADLYAGQAVTALADPTTGLAALSAKLDTIAAGQKVTLSDDQFTTLTKDVASAVSAAVGTLNLSVSTSDQAAIADAVAAELAARLQA